MMMLSLTNNLVCPTAGFLSVVIPSASGSTSAEGIEITHTFLLLRFPYYASQRFRNARKAVSTTVTLMGRTPLDLP